MFDRSVKVLMNVIAVPLLLSVLAAVGCSDSGYFLTNDKGSMVAAAVSLQSCNLLAQREFFGLSQRDQVSFNDAVRSGDIIQLGNGTSIDQSEGLDFERGYLTPSRDNWPDKCRREGKTSLRSLYVDTGGSSERQEGLCLPLPEAWAIPHPFRPDKRWPV